MLKVVSDWIDFPPVVGNVMIEEIMAVLAGMSPIAMGYQLMIWRSREMVYLRIPLHEPVVIWRPFVNVLPAQLLMKLFVDVNDLAC